jgi:TolA-binding protein
MNQEQLEQQIDYCNKELKKLSFQTLSLSKYKEFLENELKQMIDEKIRS